MINSEIGYIENPANSNAIIRARTTRQIRSWELLRSIKALEVLNSELGKVDFPGIYVLFESKQGKQKVYVGEAKNIYKRLKTHISNPDDKIRNWDRVLVINDGRAATQSDFNDTVVRKALELHLIKLLRANKYKVVSQGESQNLNAIQKHLVSTLKEDLNFFINNTKQIRKNNNYGNGKKWPAPQRLF